MPVPVYTTISHAEPVSTIGLAINLSSANDVSLVLPSWLGGVAWRVASVDVSITGEGQTGFIIRLYGGALTGATTSGSEVTFRTRPFIVSGAPTQMRVKNASKVQHASTGAGVNLAQFGPLGTTTCHTAGVLWLSVKGAI